MSWSSGYQLRILKGNQQGLVIPLKEQTYILGRATTQGETAAGYMFFYEPTVSRVHAELRWNEKRKAYLVHHQSKTNPTLVEGVPVDKKTPRPLEKGHKIQLGYLVLEVEPLSAAPAPSNEPRTSTTSVLSKGPDESAKTHKMLVGNILEALSNLNQDKAAAPPPPNSRSAAPAKVNEPENLPERDYRASDQENACEIDFTVVQGPDKGQSFQLRSQLGVIGRLMSRDDPRRGQGVLLNDDSLPQEAAFIVWQGRDRAFGLSESDAPGVLVRLRRINKGQPEDVAVSNRPVLLLDGDLIQVGRSTLQVKSKAPLQEWKPAAAAPRTMPAAVAPVPAAEEWSGPPSPWGRPAEPPPPPPPPFPGAPVEMPQDTAGVVPRNFPGASSRTDTTSVSPPKGRAISLNNATPTPVEAPPAPPTAPTLPPKPRVEATLIGRSAGPSSSLGVSRSNEPSPPPPVQPVPATPQPALDPSSAPTLGAASQQTARSVTPEDRSDEPQALSWPWRDSSDFVFDFVAGPNRGRQIALNAGDMQDDRIITLGSNSEQFDIPLDGTNYMAALRYRSRRFALLNQGPDDSVQVNRIPLKRGDQVVLMTGDRVDIGESCFRFLERAVVDVLSGFQVVVESGVDQDQDKIYPFCKQRLLIGRGKNCDVRLNDLEVSRIHVALVHRDGKFFVQHRSETNPTFLNGMSLLQGGERLISLGDRIRLSSLTLLQFAKAEARRSGAPAPRR